MQHSTIEAAADVARAHIPIQKRVVKPEYWSRYVIIKRRGSYRVIEECNLEPPSESGLLPWVDPLRDGGTIAAYVELDGELINVSEFSISVWQWPSGWGLGRRNTAPMSVQREAMRLAKEIMTPA